MILYIFKTIVTPAITPNGTLVMLQSKSKSTKVELTPPTNVMVKIGENEIGENSQTFKV